MFLKGSFLSETKLENILDKGWVVSLPAGDKIDAKFLFGKDKVIKSNELQFEVGAWDGQTELSLFTVEDIENVESDTNEIKIENENEGDQTQYAVLGIIIAVGIGAAIFYLKGYKPKH